MKKLPNYILNRFVPKKKVLKEGEIVQFTFFNMLTAFPFGKEIPTDLSGLITVTMDGEKLPEEQILKAEMNFEGKTYKITELQPLAGKTIPVGAEITFRVPDPDNIIEKGSTHKFEISVVDNPRLSFSLERTIN